MKTKRILRHSESACGGKDSRIQGSKGPSEMHNNYKKIVRFFLSFRLVGNLSSPLERGVGVCNLPLWKRGIEGDL